ncbi:MAG: hypothetical protein Q7U35_10450 [Methanobacteriaceae archaeon]|nr:hypothetical protein [Methanobacteriaceae archaeon]MDP2835469.1 hypothetical protein [Methanobacteriaceae archaeon]MDP3034775.1 hypothetical protein [Methanobacteriaceae archaeon]MDP3485155.1 hypothetical protein [Methanobacteriaceae archaeon]MDP3623155.1 hypothetical protein [Methanobacteriaceae archaeon]
MSDKSDKSDKFPKDDIRSKAEKISSKGRKFILLWVIGIILIFLW